jgi:hypothetical protein
MITLISLRFFALVKSKPQRTLRFAEEQQQLSFSVSAFTLNLKGTLKDSANRAWWFFL